MARPPSTTTRDRRRLERKVERRVGKTLAKVDRQTARDLRTLNRAARDLDPPRRRDTDRAAGRASRDITRLPALRGKTAEDIVAEELERRRGSTAYRLRKHAYPWYAAAGLAGAASATWAAGAYFDPAAVAATTGVVAGAGGGLVWLQTRRHIRKAWRQHVGAASIAAGAWLTAAAATGPSWTAAAALGAGTIGFGAKWWRNIRIPAPTAPPVEIPAPEQEIEKPPEQRMQDWAEFVACQGGPLPGSRLIGREDIDGGEAWTCQLNRTGRQTISTAMASLEQIATNLDVPPINLVIEPHPSGKPSLLLVKIMEVSPVSGDVRFTGPRWRNGLIDLGPYADGQGEYTVRLWTPGGTDNESDGSAWSTVLIGGTGMGKSRMTENFAISALSSGLVSLWYCDPQSGGSSPALKQYADWYVDGDNVDKMLVALERVVKWRSKENAAHGWTGFTPTAERPLLLVIIDECQLVFKDKKVGDRWAGLARTCRKVGISFFCATQYSGLESFGGSEPLRAALMTGNSMAMWAPSKQNGQLMPGLRVDPASLPQVAGYAFGSPTEVAREAPWRNRLVSKAAQWLEPLRLPALDRLTVKAAGKEYDDRAQSPEEVQAATVAELEAFLAGPMPSGGDERKAATGYAGPATVALNAWPSLSDFQPTPGPVDEDELDELVDDDEPGEEQPDDNITSARSVRLVLAALDDGCTTTGAIHDHTGLSESTARWALKQLIESGTVANPRRGVYELTEARQPAGT